MAVKRTIKRSAAADDILLEDAFEEYMVTKVARNLSDATLHNYRYSFNKFKDFLGENITGNVMEVGLIYKWIATMKQDGIKFTSTNSYLAS